MQDFLKEVSELSGLPERAIERDMPMGLSFDRPGEGFSNKPLKSAILCTARSGSSLLSVALEAYGFKFNEYLNARSYLAKVVSDNSIAHTSELAGHFEKIATSDGRMSIKMPINGVPHLFMMGEFPKNLGQWRFVYLRRENLVRQAISGYVAKQTGQWTKVMAATASISDDDYSFDEIMKIANAAVQGNRMIERFVGLLALPTYNIVYEDFISDQKRVLAEIAAFLGVNPADYPGAANHEPWLERQSTDLNDRWERRFREDLLRRLGD